MLIDFKVFEQIAMNMYASVWPAKVNAISGNSFASARQDDLHRRWDYFNLERVWYTLLQLCVRAQMSTPRMP